MMVNITVDEARRIKKEMEEKFERNLIELQETTGMKVSDLVCTINYIRYDKNQEVEQDFKVDITLSL